MEDKAIYMCQYINRRPTLKISTKDNKYAHEIVSCIQVPPKNNQKLKLIYFFVIIFEKS